MDKTTYLRLAALIQERDQRLKSSTTTIQRVHAVDVPVVLAALRIAARQAENLEPGRERQ